MFSEHDPVRRLHEADRSALDRRRFAELARQAAGASPLAQLPGAGNYYGSVIGGASAPEQPADDLAASFPVIATAFVGCRANAYRTQTISGNAFYPVLWDAAPTTGAFAPTYDSGLLVSGSSIATIPQSGYYRVRASIGFLDGIPPATWAQAQLGLTVVPVSGSANYPVYLAGEWFQTNPLANVLGGDVDLLLAAGDTFTVSLYAAWANPTMNTFYSFLCVDKIG